MTRFLDQFKIILLDMNSTFMFGEDRFNVGTDFFLTYQRFGGVRLESAAVNSAIRNCYTQMSSIYEDSTQMDNFPTLAEGLRKYAAIEDIDLPILEAVFAYHELGRIPDSYAACLTRLSRSHRLGLVSNIWAKKAVWLAEFERAGISNIWQTRVFSSDTRSIKPSPRLFRVAMDAFDAALTDFVFVGDSLRIDVAPAKSFGWATVWITSLADAHPLADVVVSSLLELETLPAKPAFHPCVP